MKGKWVVVDGILTMFVKWKDHTNLPRVGTIWIEDRPKYCDRGRYIAKTDLPLDNQEGWPRYYFSRILAKVEIEEWVKGRKETVK